MHPLPHGSGWVCRLLLLAGIWGGLMAAEGTPGGLDPADLAGTRTLLSDAVDAVRKNYFPADKVTKEFLARCDEAQKNLGRVASLNEAYGEIADALGSLDRRIRFYPPNRAVRVDYSWEWKIIGNGAFVTQVDQTGDARRQGLQRGDQILSLEDLPLGRENYQDFYYAVFHLAPRAGLHAQVRSPRQEPRSLAIAATIRPQRKMRTVELGQRRGTLERVYTDEEYRRLHEFRDAKSHVRRVDQVAVWHADDLRNNISAVGDGLNLVHDASALILDLRGQYVYDYDNAFRLLDGLFAERFDSGVIRQEGLDRKLAVHGGTSAFKGTVLVLVDSETAGFAEVLARIVQMRQRGVIIGDRTMGRAFQETLVGHARGASFAFTVGGVLVPSGEIVMSDGVPVDGRGVIPDYQLLPGPADLAGYRDPVMSKALALLKVNLPPEDAYKLFPHYEDTDDDYLAF